MAKIAQGELLVISVAKRTFPILICLILPWLAPNSAQAVLDPTIKHRTLLTDEGNASVLLLDQFGGKEWTVPIEGSGRDMQLIGNNRVMVSTAAGGYIEYDLTDGGVKKTLKGFGAVQTAVRLPSGHTLLSGDNLDGSSGIVVLDLDAQDKQVGKTVFAGLTTLRIMRVTAEGTLLFGSQTKVIEAKRDGTIIWQTEIPGAVVYKALRLPNGNTWVATGYSTTLVLIAHDKTILKTISGANMPKDIAPHFFGDFQILPNGHIAMTNWPNHGPGHGTEGIQALELDTAGQVVWQYQQDPARISSLHGILVLDGLDPQIAYGESQGNLTPLIPVTGLIRPHRSSLRRGGFIGNRNLRDGLGRNRERLRGFYIF